MYDGAVCNNARLAIRGTTGYIAHQTSGGHLHVRAIDLVAGNNPNSWTLEDHNSSVGAHGIAAIAMDGQTPYVVFSEDTCCENAVLVVRHLGLDGSWHANSVGSNPTPRAPTSAPSIAIAGSTPWIVFYGAGGAPFPVFVNSLQ